MKSLFKILTVIFTLLVIIPGDKLSFPVGLLIITEFGDGLLGTLFSLSMVTSLAYLFITAVTKIAITKPRKVMDDCITIVIIMFYYLLLLLQWKTIKHHGDMATLVTITLFITASLVSLLTSVSLLSLHIRTKP
jgi:hypothetical protein